MEIILKLTSFIQSLSKKRFNQVLFGTIGFSFIIVVGLNYYIYQQSTDYLVQIKQYETLTNKAIGILEDDQRMENEALRVQSLLTQNKEFDIKSYFESFCQQNTLNPTQGWETHLDDSNDKFDEISLSASFKGLSMDKVVKILEDFYKKEVIYIKSINIKQDQDKKVSFDVMIATKSMKRGLEVK